jgi:zinc protease
MNLGRIVIAVIFALAAPLAAQAANVRPLDMGKGVQVWFVEDHTLPIISMTVALPAGSAYDPANKAGLAAFAASMLDEGAGQYNSIAYHAALSNRAIRLSAAPDRDWLIITIVTLKENAKDAFRLLGTALARPRFDGDAIARVRSQILSSLDQDEEDPGTVAAKAFFPRFFPNHPYGHPVAGDAASISSINRADLVNFARDHWVRGGAHIAVSGDVDAATLKTLIASAFSTLPIRAPAPVPPVRRMGTPGTQVIPMPVPQPNIVFALPAVPRKDRDFIPLYVANYILGGGGFSSRLTDQVREKRGLTYDISTSVNTLSHAGYFAGTMATKAGSVREAIAVIRSTLADFANNGPTQKELDDAKTYLTGSFPLAFTSNVGITGQLSAFQVVGLPVDYVQKRNALINAVTADDVRRAAKRVFANPNLTLVIAGTPEAPKQAARPLPADKPTRGGMPPSTVSQRPATSRARLVPKAILTMPPKRNIRH